MPQRAFIALVVLFAFLYSAIPVFSKKSVGPAPNDQQKVVETEIAITELKSLSVFYRELEKRSEPASVEKTASLWQDFEFLFLAFVGKGYKKVFSYDDFRRAYCGEIRLTIPFHHSLLKKDKLAYNMSLLGYSAKEISDVITGRITVAALDNATKMRMLGRSEKEISGYLDSIYRKMLKAQRDSTIFKKQADATHSETIIGPRHFDEVVVRYSQKYGLDPNIIRAMIKVESNWNHRAVSKKGAIGLMQLMPGTARLLRVDPRHPEQNVEGGVRYFTFLVSTFRNLDLALIAYNAGPGYAERYSRGKTFLYGETREYVRSVKTILSLKR